MTPTAVAHQEARASWAVTGLEEETVGPEQVRVLRPRRKVAFVGSQDYPDLTKVGLRLLDFADQAIILVSGGARGVDREAERLAVRAGIPVIIFRVRARDGYFSVVKETIVEQVGIEEVLQHTFRSFVHAAFWRNDLILKEVQEPAERPGYVVIFWDGMSPGTRWHTQECLKRRLDHEVNFPHG